MTRIGALGPNVMVLILLAGCSSEADTTDADSAVGPDTSAIQGAGTVPTPAPSTVDSLRDTARQKTP